MKSDEQLKEQLKKISLLRGNSSQQMDELLTTIKPFFKKYPQYDQIEASGPFFIAKSLKYGKVNAWRFGNGDVLFIGIDPIGRKNNCPLAGIGDGEALPLGFEWNNPGTFLEFVEEIKAW